MSTPRSPARDPHHAAQPRLGDLVGHCRVVEVLSTVVEVARSQEGVLPSALFTDRPGLGKTTLAGALAGEMGVAFRPVLGPLLDDATVLLSQLAGLERGDVFFVDEIHAVPRHVLEVLELNGGPMGRDHLATHVGKPREAILELYESDLVRTGWVRRMPRGRVLARPRQRLRAIG